MIDASRLFDDAWGTFAVEVAAKATLVLLTAAGLTAAMRTASAAWRHRVWSLAFAGMLLVPACQLALPGWTWRVLPAQWRSVAVEPIRAEAPIVDPVINEIAARPQTVQRAAGFESNNGAAQVPMPSAEASTASAEPLTNPQVSRQTAETSITPSAQTPTPGTRWFGVWAVGAALGLAPLVIGLLGNARLKRRARPIANAALSRRVAVLSRQTGLRRPPLVSLGDDAQMPMTFGMRRPVVIMPASATRWSDERFRSVMLHELAHIRRGDVGWQLLCRAACAVYWFNPLAWWALGRMRQDRELACDDCVLSAGQSSTNYAAELLDIAREHSIRFPAMCAALSMARRSQLEGRILAVLDADRRRAPAGAVRTAALALVGAASVAGLSVVRPALHATAAEQVASAGTPAAQRNDDICIVTGVVLLPDGAPAAGAEIEVLAHDFMGGWNRPLRGEQPLVRQTTRADAAGRFRIAVPRDIHRRRRAVNVIAVGSSGFPAYEDVDARRRHIELTLQLLPTKTVRLQLVDPVGMPIEGLAPQVQFGSLGASQYLYSPVPALHEAAPSWLRFSSSDADGYASADLPSTAESLTLYINDPERGAHRLEVKLADGPVSAVIDATRFINGTVTDPEGSPVAGAEVVLMEEPFRVATTDAQGKFRVAHGSTIKTLFQNNESIIHVYPPAESPFLFHAVEWKWPNEGIGDAEITVKLTRGNMIEGRVVEQESGQAIAGARLRFDPQEYDNPHYDDSMKSRFSGADMAYETDADGRFRLPVSAGPGRLVVQGPTFDFVPVETSMGDEYYGKPGLQREYFHGVRRLNPSEGATVEPLTIELERGITLKRRVVRPDGTPAEGIVMARSYLEDREEIHDSMPLAPIADGELEMPGFEPRRSTPMFLLDVAGACGAVVSLAREHISPDDPTIKLLPCGSAKFRFVDDKGEPLATFRPPIKLIMTPGATATHHIEEDQPLWSDTIIWDNVIRPHELPKTDDDGSVTVTGLIPGADYLMYYVGTKGTWDSGYPFTIKPGETTDVGEVSLPRQE